jgi:CheY-like chemotaxis protein
MMMPLESPLILIVDDGDDDRFFLRTAIAKAEFQNPLREVVDGEDALAYLRGDAPYQDRAKNPLPAIMLLDLNMPRASGFDVLTWVRGDGHMRRLSVIVMSASRREEDVGRAFDLGASAYLVKPGTQSELVEMMRCLRAWLRFNHFPPLSPFVA